VAGTTGFKARHGLSETAKKHCNAWTRGAGGGGGPPPPPPRPSPPEEGGEGARLYKWIFSTPLPTRFIHTGDGLAVYTFSVKLIDILSNSSMLVIGHLRHGLFVNPLSETS
jgi:hypothetical protein